MAENVMHGADGHGDAGHATEWGTGEGYHTHWKMYTVIGVILTVITAVEVAVFYIDALAPVLVPTLIVLSLAKFILVVQYYMHLKQDHSIFGRVFWAPLTLAVLVVVGMIILFKVLPEYGVLSSRG